jgi:hypothetical protein
LRIVTPINRVTLALCPLEAAHPVVLGGRGDREAREVQTTLELHGIVGRGRAVEVAGENAGAAHELSATRDQVDRVRVGGHSDDEEQGQKGIPHRSSVPRTASCAKQKLRGGGPPWRVMAENAGSW